MDIKTLPNISLEQQNIITLLKEQNNVIVESVAGSGKTTTNLYIAKSFPESNILLLTYNAKLKIETRDRIISHNIKNIETHSYHSFCVKYYNNKAYTDTEILNILTNNNKIKIIINYDIIILDELQDISPLYYQLICKIFKDNKIKAKICILGDRYQTIYDFKGADSRYIIYASILFNYNTNKWVNSKLSQSYRITFEMSEFINKCLLNEDRIISHKISHNKPQYIICDTFDNTTNNSAFIQVKTFLSLGYKPTDIFILAPSIKAETNPVHKLENLIKQNIINIPVYVPSSDDEKIDSDVLKNKLVFSTFHQAKGLERKIVIVYNFDDSYFEFFSKDKNPLLCPNEYYVATTRSSEHLILIHHYTNNYFKFINIDNLKTYCDIQYHEEHHNRYKNEKMKMHNISVTQLIKYLPDEVLTHCVSYLKIIKLNDKESLIDIPIKIKSKYGYENVSDITGTLIPAFYQYKTTNIMTIYNESLEHYNNKTEENIDFIDDNIIKPIKTYNLNNIDIKKENIDELLYIANYYCSLRSGFLFKLYQIDEYNWLTKDNLNLSYNRLSKFISNTAKYEVKCDSGESTRSELLNKRLTGYVDCIDDNKIYEFKCVQKLENEHYLQLSIYMYLYETKHKLSEIEKYNKKLDKYKYKLSVYLELIKKNNYILDKITKKQKKMINELTIENNNILKKIKKRQNKIEILEKNKPITNHIITNKYYLYNILSNEMHQIICEYNEIVSMIDYLIKSKYLHNKKENDEVFIKNNKKFYDKYFIQVIVKNTKQKIKNNNTLEINTPINLQDNNILEIKTPITKINLQDNNTLEIKTPITEINLQDNNILDELETQITEINLQDNNTLEINTPITEINLQDNNTLEINTPIKKDDLSNNIYKTYKSDKIVLDIETDKYFNILQIAYNMYDNNNNLIHSKDFYIYDGIHSKPFFPIINEDDIIKYGISLKDASDIITKDINNTLIIIGHNIKSFDLVHITKLNDKFNNKIKDTLIIHDTMSSSKNIIKATNKIGKLKNPRLDEMLMFLCSKSVENHHNALGDIIATFDCYKILCDKYNCFQ